MAKRLGKELQELTSDTPPYVKSVGLVGDNLYKWKISLTGPDKSPYEKGIFQIELEIPTDYPFKAPTVKFLTKIYHPNIKSDGGICAGILNDNWSPQLKISEVLLTLRQALAEPNPDNPLEADIANQYKTDKAAFNKTAKEWTKKYAKSV